MQIKFKYFSKCSLCVCLCDKVWLEANLEVTLIKSVNKRRKGKHLVLQSLKMLHSRCLKISNCNSHCCWVVKSCLSLLWSHSWGHWGSDTTERLHFHALEKEMATHSSVPAWRIPGMGEPDGLPSMGSRRVGQDWSDSAAAAAGSSVLLFQARILECVAISFSRRSSRYRDQTHFSRIGSFTAEPPEKPHNSH